MVSNDSSVRTGQVVVGYDESATMPTVLECAAVEAAQRGAALLVVHGFSWPWISPPLLPPVISEPVDPHPRARMARHLAGAVEDLHRRHPDLAIDTRLIDGHAAQILVDYSRGAAVVVVGHRGSGGFSELLAGSVAVHTAAHACSPVLIVRGTATANGPVVIGVDGSPDAGCAAEIAFAAAARRGVPVTAVTVAPPTEHRRQPGPSPKFAREILAGVCKEYPDVALHAVTIRSASPAGAIVDAARNGALVVVGSRGLGGLRGMLLGSVGRALIEHSPCPVMIARPTTGQPPS